MRFFLIFLLIHAVTSAQEVQLSGRVTDGRSLEPVAGAEVRVFLGSSMGEAVLLTDAEGRFALEASRKLTDRDYVINVHKPGYYLLNGTVKLNYGELPERHFRLYRVPEEEQDEPAAVQAVSEPEVAGQPGPTLLGAPVNNLVFLIDVSGSMREENRLENLKESLLYLVKLYRPEDRISIVTYATSVQVILDGGRISEMDRIESIINGLQPAGTTQGIAGLIKAYDVAVGQYLRGGTNKIVLATDGVFGEDKKSRKLIESIIAQGAADDIRLSVFSIGNEAQMYGDRLGEWSSLGSGNYTHIQSVEDTKSQLVREARGE